MTSDGNYNGSPDSLLVFILFNHVKEKFQVLTCIHYKKKYTSVMIRVYHSTSQFLSCIYIHDKFMTESR